MMQNPRQLSYFIYTCTRIYKHYWPVEKICSGSSERNRETPHTHGKTIHIKQSITAGAENTIYCNIVDGTSYHIKCYNGKHAL